MKLHFSLQFSLLLISFWCFQNADATDNQFSINGICSDTDSGLLIVNYKHIDGKTIRDTCVIESGHFNFKTNLNYPTKFSLRIEGYSKEKSKIGYSFNVYACSGNNQIICSIKLDNKNLSFNCKEAKIQQDFDSKIDSLLIAQNKINDTIKTFERANKKNKKRVVFLENKRNEKSIQIWSETKSYAIGSANSFFLPEALFYAQSFVPIDSLSELFNQLYPTIQKTYFTEELRKELSKYNNTKIGSILPTIISQNQFDTLINLKEIKRSKIQILEFWASWCLPCIQNNIEIKKIVQKYSTEEVAVIGISLDNKKAAWIEAIEKQDLKNWIHVLFKTNEEYGIDNYSASNLLYCNGVPLTLLINKDGKIIGKWEGYNAKHFNEIDIIIKKILHSER